ncbi:MAG: ABC transporter permease [Bacteroidota bacterium]|nr:ABC transporter permease [bacterium]NBP63815.1 ABC transporter permease [Bacteroidota bacterium]
MFFTVLSIELSKIFSKGRSYIGFGAITVLVPIVQAAMYSEGEAYFSLFTQGLQQQFSFTGTFLNGYLIAFVVLQSLLVHVPLLVTLVAGDMLAGEATGGTYRILFTRPVSRYTIVLAKYSAALLYTIGLIAWMSILSMGLSLLIFGPGELFIVSSAITVLPKDDIIWRFAYAYLFGILSMSTVASISFMFSALVENSIGPIAMTMAIIIVFTIISALDAGFIKDVKYMLFTNHLISWRLFFEETVPVDRILLSTWVLGGHSLFALLTALFVIVKKDILS